MSENVTPAENEVCSASYVPGDGPGIYVACLAAYNNGILHGAWIDAVQDAEDIEAEVQAMLAKSPIPGAEEWAIHDYSGFGSVNLSEWASFEDVAALAALIDEHGDVALAALALCDSEKPEDVQEMIDDCYQGEYSSNEDFAEELYSECYSEEIEKMGSLTNYIDWSRVARDLMMDYHEHNGHYFRVQ